MNDINWLFISILTFIFLLFSNNAIAQHSTARWMAGNTTGGIGQLASGDNFFFVSDTKFSVELSPQVSKFVTNKVQLGGQLGFSLETGDGLTLIVVGLVPFYRLNYKGVKKWTPYFEVGGGPFYVYNEDNNFGITGHFFHGLDYFLLERVAIGARVGTTFNRAFDTFTVGFPLRFSIQLLLGK